MSDNKHVKTLANSGTLTGLAAGIRWDAKKEETKKDQMKTKKQAERISIQ